MPESQGHGGLQLLYCPDPRSSPQKQNNCLLNPQKPGTVPRVKMNQPAGVHVLSLVVQENSEGAPLGTRILPQNRGAEGREQEYEGERERRAREPE